MKRYQYFKGQKVGEWTESKKRCPESGKVSYQSHTQALIAGGKVLKEGQALRAYFCETCAFYHLTSKL